MSLALPSRVPTAQVPSPSPALAAALPLLAASSQQVPPPSQLPPWTCRLNYRLSVACEQDVDSLCAQECHSSMGQSCGGRVLRCLTEKQEQLSSQACKDEVFYFEKMEVNDYRNDVILAEACRTDVDKLCKKVPRGAGRRMLTPPAHAALTVCL